MFSELSNKAKQDYFLVQQAIKGDQHAFAELLGRYWDSVFYMLLKMVHNKDDAEDLTIEAFGKAFKNLKQYTPEYAFSTWLFRIASNNCIDFIRKRKMTGSVSINLNEITESGDDLADILPSPTRNPEEDIIRQQRIQALRDVIDRLKPQYRRLIELRYYEERSYEEISVELNLPIGTVKAQLFRARELIYHILKNRPEKFTED